MKSLSPLSDPIESNAKGFSVRFGEKWLNDKRDIPFVKLLLFINFSVIPLGILLFFPLLTGLVWWLVFLFWFWLAQIYLRGPFGLMLHNIAHRPMFKKKYNWANHYVIWFVCPFFGHTPETYFAHHLGMHHRENNMPADGSSTMRYQRDSLVDFLKYYLRFLLFGFRDTFRYLRSKKMRRYYTRLTAGEGTFFLFCAILLIVSMKATFFVVILPFLFSRLIMMLGNWTQHAFIDPDNPENTYRSSYNCINTSYNKRCWNDGYHLIHHLKPGAHYTDMPTLFLKEQPKMIAEKSLVFDGIHYLHLFYYLMTKKYDQMADNLVDLDNVYSSRDDAIATLRARTMRFAV